MAGLLILGGKVAARIDRHPDTGATLFDPPLPDDQGDEVVTMDAAATARYHNAQADEAERRGDTVAAFMCRELARRIDASLPPHPYARTLYKCGMADRRRTFTMIGSCRMGTLLADEAQLRAAFGKPWKYGGRDGKVTAEWFLNTPRGMVSLYDFHWNPPGQWSIGAGDRRAARWAVRYLAAFGFRALTDRQERRRQQRAALN